VNLSPNAELSPQAGAGPCRILREDGDIADSEFEPASCRKLDQSDAGPAAKCRRAHGVATKPIQFHPVRPPTGWRRRDRGTARRPHRRSHLSKRQGVCFRIPGENGDTATCKPGAKADRRKRGEKRGGPGDQKSLRARRDRDKVSSVSRRIGRRKAPRRARALHRRRLR